MRFPPRIPFAVAYRRILNPWNKNFRRISCFFLEKEKSWPGDSSKRRGRSWWFDTWRCGVFLTPEDGRVLPCSEELLGKCSAWNDFTLLYNAGIQEVFHSDFTQEMDHVWPHKSPISASCQSRYWLQSIPNQWHECLFWRGLDFSRPFLPSMAKRQRFTVRTRASGQPKKNLSRSWTQRDSTAARRTDAWRCEALCCGPVSPHIWQAEDNRGGCLVCGCCRFVTRAPFRYILRVACHGLLWLFGSTWRLERCRPWRDSPEWV